MISLGWPNLFSSSCNTELLEDKQAIKTNLILLLNSERSSLYGDPYYGTYLKRYLFEQNSSNLVDLIIDEIYTTIETYIPQIYVSRGDIRLYSNRYELFAQLRVTYRADGTSDLYYINLTNNVQEG